MGSSAKTGNYYYWRVTGVLFLGQKHKSAIYNRTPPTYTSNLVYMCAGGVQGSQIFKQNWIILIQSRVILILLIWVSSTLGGRAGGWGCLGWSTIVYMSSGMFRGNESSNRIELSRLVQELLNFGVSGSLQLWGMGVGWIGVQGGWGVPPTHVHMHMHACTHTHAHACVVNMIISCKWLPPFGESMGIPYDVIHTCTCMHVHVHMCGGHPLTTPTPSTHPHPPGGPPESVKIQ